MCLNAASHMSYYPPKPPDDRTSCEKGEDLQYRVSSGYYDKGGAGCPARARRKTLNARKVRVWEALPNAKGRLERLMCN